MTETARPHETADLASLELQARVTEQQLAALTAAQLAMRPSPNDWDSLGETLEGMCKAGLALTVGFSVAAAFCKMMDQKKVDLPSIINRVAGGMFLAPTPKRGKDEA